MPGWDRAVIALIESRVLKECFNAIRNQISRAVIRAIYDDAAQKTVDLVANAGQERTKVPVHEPFGFTSHPPLNGAITHLIANGGDASDLIALQLSNPTVARFGNLKEGETVLYDSVGQRLHLKDGKFVRLDACDSFQVGFGPDETVLEVNPSGVKITGTLEVSKGVTVKGAVTLNDALTVKRDIQTQGDVKSRNVSLQEHIHKTASTPPIPTTPPATAGGKTPDPDPDDDPDKKPDDDLPPKSEIPWRNIEGKQKISKDEIITEVPPVENPEETASEIATELKDFAEKYGDEELERADLQGKDGNDFVRYKGNDGTSLGIRTGKQSGKLTDDDTVTIDFNGNKTFKKDTGKSNWKVKIQKKGGSS